MIIIIEWVELDHDLTSYEPVDNSVDNSVDSVDNSENPLTYAENLPTGLWMELWITRRILLIACG